jgi:hypothetical protein
VRNKKYNIIDSKEAGYTQAKKELNPDTLTDLAYERENLIS